MTSRKKIVALLFFTLVSGCLLRRSRPLAEYLIPLSGRDFIDCGSYMPGMNGWEANQKKVLDCAMNAVAQKRSFRFQESHLGIDAVSTTGLIGTSSGAVLRYQYLGKRSGCRSCSSSFTSELCPKPDLYMQGPWLRFGCGESH